MKKLPLYLLTFLICFTLTITVAYAQDPLPSWNEGPASRAAESDAALDEQLNNTWVAPAVSGRPASTPLYVNQS